MISDRVHAQHPEYQQHDGYRTNDHKHDRNEPREPCRDCSNPAATLPGVTDDELTDDWQAGTVSPGGISHLQHLRIAWILHRRHGAEEARTRLLDGTKRACDAHGCPDKFDPALTDRWARAIADAIEHDGLQATADQFLAAHPELRRSDLLGRSKPQQP